jgi:hypothetical protein
MDGPGGVFGDFLKGIFVASSSAIAGYALRSLVEYYRMRKFRKVFGSGVREPNDLMISVPLWQALEGDRRVNRFLKADASGTREEYYGPSEMYNADDMVAAAYVLNVIGNHFSQPVEYTNDKADAKWNQKTVIIIGSPAANYHARYYMERFGLSLPHFEHIEEDNVTGARAVVKIPETGEVKRSGGGKDYGLIVRMPNLFCGNGEFFVFLVAGIHAASTREAARLLNKEWNRKFLKTSSAGIVFEMDHGKEGTGIVLYPNNQKLTARLLAGVRTVLGRLFSRPQVFRPAR